MSQSGDKLITYLTEKTHQKQHVTKRGHLFIRSVHRKCRLLAETT